MGMFSAQSNRAARLRKSSRSGMVLIIVLWILVLLVILAAGLSRRGSVNVALAQLAAGQIRAQYLAFSALRYAVALIELDTKDEKGSRTDTLYQCGFSLQEGLTPEKLFKRVAVPGGYFEIVTSWQRDEGSRRYGMSDEESRINLNAVSAADYQVLMFMILDAGFDKEIAQTVAASVVDWVDQDNEVFKEPYGRENDPADLSKTKVRNRAFQSVQELLLVRGMTPEIFEAIKNDLTVFPQTSGLTVNINTATPGALRALARNFTGNRTNTEVSDADSLVEKLLRYRRGPDDLDGTDDDRDIESQDLRLNVRETALMAQLEGYRARISNFIRIGIRAVDEESKVEYRAEAVIARSAGKAVYWQKIR